MLSTPVKGASERQKIFFLWLFSTGISERTMEIILKKIWEIFEKFTDYAPSVEYRRNTVGSEFWTLIDAICHPDQRLLNEKVEMFSKNSEKKSISEFLLKQLCKK